MVISSASPARSPSNTDHDWAGWRQRRDQVHAAFKHASEDLDGIADKYQDSPPPHRPPPSTPSWPSPAGTTPLPRSAVARERITARTPLRQGDVGRPIAAGPVTGTPTRTAHPKSPAPAARPSLSPGRPMPSSAAWSTPHHAPPGAPTPAPPRGGVASVAPGGWTTVASLEQQRLAAIWRCLCGERRRRCARSRSS